MPDTQVVSSVPDQTISCVRIFDAPREMVWRAWTEPEQFSCWAGCDGHSMPLARLTMDVRRGGAFHFTMVNDANGDQSVCHATYREVVEPERLVWVHDDRVLDEIVTTVTLVDLGDGRTEMHFEQRGFGAGDLEAGLRDTRAGHAEEIDKLAHYLASVSAPR